MFNVKRIMCVYVCVCVCVCVFRKYHTLCENDLMLHKLLSVENFITLQRGTVKKKLRQTRSKESRYGQVI
jgi:hypothetical protein